MTEKPDTGCDDDHLPGSAAQWRHHMEAMPRIEHMDWEPPPFIMLVPADILISSRLHMADMPGFLEPFMPPYEFLHIPLERRKAKRFFRDGNAKAARGWRRHVRRYKAIAARRL